MQGELGTLLGRLQLELQGVTAPTSTTAASQWLPRRARVEIALEMRRDPEGQWALAPSSSEEKVTDVVRAQHRATIEFEVAGTPLSIPSSAPLRTAEPPARPADGTTLRRRLELILGGPPGFTTGARAEILADLLSEFGRAQMLEVLRREWITQFDTGPDQSGSVTQAGPAD